MALSSFIKQLLETDTVFGSEAKKMTGINDAVIKVNFSDIDISFNVVDGILQFTIHNYVAPSQSITWLTSGKYIVFNFIQFDRSNSLSLNLLDYEAKLFQIATVTQSNSNLVITFNKDAEGTPEFNKLVEIDNLSPVTVRLDGRIFALIGDPDIARASSSGATMFNVDNMSTTGLAADSSGIARKFASHYHTDIAAEAVLNEKDEEGRDLARIVIENTGTSQLIEFNENIARTQAFENDDDGVSIKVEARTTTGTNTTIAQYGQLGKLSSGLLTTVITVPYSRIPNSTNTNDQEELEVKMGVGSVNFFFNSNSAVGANEVSITLPPGPSISVTIASTPANRDKIYVVRPGDTKSDSNAYQAVTSTSQGTIAFSRLFLISSNNNTTAQNLANAIEFNQSDIITARTGATLNLSCTFSFAFLLGSVEVDGGNPAFSISQFNPGVTDLNVIKQQVAVDMINILNDRIPQYEFTTTPGTGTNHLINYVSREPFFNNSVSTTRSLGSQVPGAFTFAFTVISITSDGKLPTPLSGNEFFTFSELINLLETGIAAPFGFDIKLLEPGFIISSTEGTSKFISFLQTTGNTAFVNLKDSSAGLSDLPITVETFNGIKVGAPKLVFDNNGSVVFNLPTTIYTEGLSVVP